MTIKVKDNTLFFDGCNTVELAKKYGTPLYVYSKSIIESHFDELKTDFLERWPKTRVAYAAKAFCTVGMCRLVDRAGMCIDVVSGGELYTALAAGFPPAHIELNGNNKLKHELELAIESNVGRIIVDGFTELDMIEEICMVKNKIVNILYRITPGIKADSHDYIITGKKDSKFGFPIDEDLIYPAIEKAINSPYVNFLGFHFHIGSQLFDNTPFIQATDIVLELVRQVKTRFKYDVTELNLGGGYGITYTNEKRLDYSYFLEPMMEQIEKTFKELNILQPSVVIEPGRSIVGDAGISLYTIGSIKDIKGVRKYVAVDGGMTDNIRPTLYQAEYKCIIANKADLTPVETVTVCGKCCETGDILIHDTNIPATEPNDILAVFSTGAYGYSMASNYNNNPIPAVVLVKDGKDEIMVHRQSYGDIIRNQVIPESLKR